MKLKLDCGGVIIELATAPGESLSDALDAVLSRTEGLQRLFQIVDDLGGGDGDDDDEDSPSSPGDDGGGGATVDVDRLLTSAGIATG